MPLQAIRFIDETVTVEFDQAPVRIKNPHCPDRFVWDGEVFAVETLLEEWRDHSRHGRMARNMRPGNKARALRTGSWGVGRIYFRIATAQGRCFDLYYNRAPVPGAPEGQWILYRELGEVN